MNASAKILVVDDEAAIRRYLRVALGAQGYAVEEASNGEEALQAAATRPPDLMILDLGLPDVDGVEVTRRLREWSQIPVLVLSVRDAESDKIAALDAGADDYLTKPFGTGELMARIRVALRSTAASPGQPVLQTGVLRMDQSTRLFTVAGREIPLTPTEYDLLRLLMQNPGKVLTHGQVLRKIWGQAYSEELHILRVNISNLRRKIEADPSQPQYLLTESGVGYRLRGEM
jgi:two-component system, OmpR family, KDP operon response regulator KdpE